MLWLGVLLWAGSGLAQEEVTTEEPERSLEEQAQWEEVERMRSGYMEAYEGGNFEEAARLCEREGELLRSMHGPGHADYANSIHNLAMIHQSMGDYEGALALHHEATELRREVLGEEHPDYATSLNSLAMLLKAMGELEEALPLYERALELRRATLGEEHLDYAGSLNNLAVLHEAMGKLDEALPYYEQALTLYQKLLGSDHPHYAICMGNLANLHQQSGRYEEALNLHQQASALLERALGEGHPSFAQSLNNLAVVHSLMGEQHKALPLLERAAELYAASLGEAHPDYAKSLNNLATLYQFFGDFEEARRLIRRALDIQSAALGEEHPELATTLYTLAQLNQQLGQRGEALLLYQRVNEIVRASLGEEHPSYAYGLNMLALLYETMGSHEQARALYEQTLELRAATLGEEHPLFAESLNNLASLHWKLGHREQAQSLYQEALEKVRASLSESHPTYSILLNNLATDMKRAGAYEEALPVYEQALEIQRRAFGPLHPELANSLRNLAGLHSERGALEQALPLYQEALEIQLEVLGAEHLEVASTLYSLADFHESSGSYDEALSLYQQSMRAQETNLTAHIGMGSPKQKLSYLETLSGKSQQLYRLALQRHPSSSRFAELASETLLQRKGRAFEAEADTLGRLRESLDDEGLSQLRALQALNSHIELTTRAPPADAEALTLWRAELGTLQDQQEQLQEALATRSLTLRRAGEPVTLQRILDQLPRGAALLEWIQWLSEEAPGEFIPHYGVFLLTPEGLQAWTDLGEAASIDQQIDQLRRDIQREGALGFEGWGPSTSKSAAILYQSLLAPLEEELTGVDQLFVSPDGELTLLPFDSLLDADGQSLGERFLVTSLTSGRDLLRMDEHPSSEGPPVIIAGVDFGEASVAPSADEGILADAKRSIDETQYEALTGTVREGEFLQDLLWGSALYTGSEATEDQLKSMTPPSVLHIATHGYFLPAEASAETQRDGTRGAAGTATPRTPPLLRSGLVLAGANTGGQDEENGFLSAAELINMDLRGTELVVLSACETGIGEVQVGEGVQGLSKALQVAGSDTQVLSLWKVSDEATQILMQEFYTRLIDGVGRGEALRQAKAALREDPRFGHPFYWAAFVLSGDWRPLDAELGKPSLRERWRQRRIED